MKAIRMLLVAVVLAFTIAGAIQWVKYVLWGPDQSGWVNAPRG